MIFRKQRFLIYLLLYISTNVLSAQSNELNYKKAKSYYFTNPDSTIYFAQQFDSLGTIKNDPLLKARARHLEGVMYQLRSISDSALLMFDQMLVNAEKANDDTLKTIALISKGLMFVHTGQFDSAMNAYLEGERLAGVIGFKKYQLRAMAEIARIYSLRGEHDIALEKCRSYLSQIKNIGGANDLVTAYAYISVEFMHLQEHDSSLYYINKTLSLQRQNKNLTGVASALLNRGSVYKELNLMDSALRNFSEAAIYYEQSNYIQGLGQLYLNIATMHINLNQANEAIEALNKAITYSTQIHDLHALNEIYSALAHSYEISGKINEAYAALKQERMLSDSLYSLEKERLISELQTQYETEKKEQTIAVQTAEIDSQAAELKVSRILSFGLIVLLVLLLVIGIQQRKYMLNKRDKLIAEEKTKLKESQIEAAINTQEEERKRFARDLHDGFGQLISVLNLNLRTLYNQPEKRQEVFDNSTEILDQMYKELKGICFNLMPETLIKNGITDAIQEFADRINRSGKIQIETNFFGIEERLTDLQEISLYRITQEWVNNVIKYSDAQKITIQLTKDEDELTLLIEDDGMGFDKSLLLQGSGNGWKNLSSRANLIKGELELDTEEARKGNTLIVEIATNIKPIESFNTQTAYEYH